MTDETASRPPLLPYGRQIIDDADCRSVMETLRSDWLTTGPKVVDFEKAFARFCACEEAVAVANGTAALHAAVAVLGIRPGDEVIVSPMTFAASVNCVVYAGAIPVFADVDPHTLLMDPESVRSLVKIHPRIKALIPVDYAGQPCDYDALRAVAPGIPVIADACHSVGATYKGSNVGAVADMTCFSFHPVKHFTTGEGGAITTNNPEYARRLRIFRNHGIDTDHRQRAQTGSWRYDMKTLGFNYRLTDIQCALGLSQIGKLPRWLETRRRLAGSYAEGLSDAQGIRPLTIRTYAVHAWHLYVVMVEPDFGVSRDQAFTLLRDVGIGANVHYWPVHLHSYYRERFKTGEGLCPVAEAAGEKILTLPLWAGMDEGDVHRVMKALEKIRSTSGGR